MENGYKNTLLKVTAILLIVSAILGVVSAVMLAAGVGREIGGVDGIGGMMMQMALDDPAFLADAGVSSPEELQRVLETDEFQDIMGATLGVVYAMMIVVAAIAAIPRLIAGIMGLSRASRPEKSGFFLGWGITLLVLGVIGMLFAGGLFSLNGMISFVGGVVLPILYLVGSSQLKKEFWRRHAAGEVGGPAF
ncbi:MULTISPECIES: hypothetical protein [Anaerotruncus]|jgi:hypothetical protein|uniref:DUF4064 domain-containing protein n=1 Tax=Anaerotruncus colihominis TaxID=169435 RepID=A0A845T330_9FIRM|nr:MULTISPECIES: hypothetical protein [Anaerotruncus]MCI8493728.1 hypothetical protein [Anaerotruncus sp.]MCR2025173.1 hypothetical protein [Anaerotruncus colihominis]NDO40527.1 hypothetical protein [Anaerotruncus colihominis]